MEADKKMTLRPQTPCCSGWARNVGSVQISQSCSICRNDESMAERNTCKHVYRYRNRYSIVA